MSFNSRSRVPQPREPIAQPAAQDILDHQPIARLGGSLAQECDRVVLVEMMQEERAHDHVVAVRQRVTRDLEREETDGNAGLRSLPRVHSATASALASQPASSTAIAAFAAQRASVTARRRRRRRYQAREATRRDCVSAAARPDRATSAGLICVMVLTRREPLQCLASRAGGKIGRIHDLITSMAMIEADAVAMRVHSGAIELVMDESTADCVDWARFVEECHWCGVAARSRKAAALRERDRAASDSPVRGALPNRSRPMKKIHHRGLLSAGFRYPRRR